MEDVKTIMLQRQGVGESRRGSIGNIHIEIGAGPLGFYPEVTQTIPGEGKRLNQYKLLLARTGPYPTLRRAKDACEKVLHGVKIDDRTAAYMYYSPKDKELWPNVKDDVYEPRARYEESTATIRSVPEHFCLVAFKADDTTDESFPDAAAREWLPLIADAMGQYTQPVNRRHGIASAREYCAWLISEYIKEGKVC